MQPGDVPSRPGQVTLGFGVLDHEIDESVDTLFPLAVPAHGLLYFNPKLSLSDRMNPSVSLGLGYRHIFEGPKIIVGGNLFYDSYNSDNDHHYNQFGVGAEVMSRWVDFRANYYLPEQNRRVINSNKTIDISSKSTMASQPLGPRAVGDTLGFNGHNLVDTVTMNNQMLNTVTLHETETTHFWEQYEGGMRGFDSELGVLIPGLDRYAETRIFGGYYFFQNPFGKDISGFKGRVEVRALPAITFDAAYYASKEIIGSNWYYGIRINAPFDLANIAHHKSPFAGFSEAFKPKNTAEQDYFASRLTENVIRTSRVSLAQSKPIQVKVQKETYTGTTSYITGTTSTKTTILTLGGAPILLTHVDSAAVAGGDGTAEHPYFTLTLADADAIKRNIVYLRADSVFSGQTITLAANQQLLGDSKTGTNLIQTDQLGTVALPHASAGVAQPLLTNPGGAIVNVTSGNVVSNLHLDSAARGIYAAAGASNTTITNSIISNMTTTGIEIKPSTSTTISGVTFTNNNQDVILNASNTTILNTTSTGAVNGAIQLLNTTGTTTLANVSITGAGGFGLQVSNSGGTHNISNLDVTGGTGFGIDIETGSGTFNFDGASSVTNTGLAGLQISGGSSVVNYGGSITQGMNAPAVAVLGGHTGSATFSGGTVAATAGQGLLFDNANGTYKFLGTTTLKNGANLQILNNSAGALTFGTGASIVNGAGQSILINGSTASLNYSGSVTTNTGSLLQIIDHTTGTIQFDTGTLTATGGDGLQFNNADGIYKFLGTANIGGTTAGVTMVNGTDGTFSFDTATTLTNPTGTAFFVNGGTSSVTYSGSIVANTAFALQVINHSTGTIAFNTGSVQQTGGNGVQFVNDSGIYSLADTRVTNSTGTSVQVDNSAAGTFTFNSVTLTNSAGTAVQLTQAGTVNLLGGTINGAGGNGIFSQNTTLTATGLTLGANHATTINGLGVQVINNDGTARTVTVSNNNIRSNGAAILTTDGGNKGELTLVLDGNTLETLAGGAKALSITGGALNSTIVKSMNGGTVIANGTGGGLLFNRVTFDASGAALTGTQVAAGNWNIGQGTAAGQRVLNDGLHFDGPTGDLAFGMLNIFNNAGTGLFVDTKTLGTTFSLSNTGGVVDTTGGTALNEDPLTTHQTFTSVTSTNSGGAGVIVNGLTSGSTLTIGTTTVSGAAGDGIVVQNSAGSMINFGTTHITNVGGDGINLTQAGNANVIFGATTINGFGTNKAGVDFKGSDVTATFGVTDIQNGGNGIGIDLSGSLNNRTISFAGGSNIHNVAIGVELSGGGVSANSNFTFGDGTAANGKGSFINAPITVDATNLNPATGTYNFLDVNFTGTANFPAIAGGPTFVSATAVNGVGDGSLANPYSVHDADAITVTGTNFVFLDGTYNFATLNAGAEFSLSTGQNAAGFDNGNSITFGSSQQANILGDFGMLSTTVNRGNTGNGTLSISNTTAGGDVFDLLGGNQFVDLNLSGAGGVSHVIQVDGGAAGFNNTGGITISGTTIGSVATGSTALNFLNATGSVSATGNNINVAGTLVNVTGGSAAYTIDQGTLPGGATPGTLAGSQIVVTGTTGGSFESTGAAITTSGNTAVTLNGNAATTTITGATINHAAGDTAFNIDQTVASTGKVTVNGGTTINNAAGVAFRVGAGVRDIDASTVNLTNDNSTGGVVAIAGQTGGTIKLGNITNSGSSTNGVINITGQTGGTASFGNVAITGYAGGGTAVSAAGAGNLAFNQLDVTTTSGNAFTDTGLGLTITNTSSLSATNGQALGLTNVALAAPVTFSSLASTNSASTGVGFSNVSGAAFNVTGSVTVSGNALTFDGLSIVNSAAAFNFQGTTTVTNAGASGIALSGADGAVTFGSIDINGGAARGVDILGVTNNVTFNGGSIGATTVTNGFAVAIANQAASSTIAFNNVSTTASGSDDFNLSNNSGTVTVVGGTHTQNGGSDVLDVESLNATGVVNFGGAIVHNGTGIAAQGVEIDNSSGTINVTGTVTAANGAQTVLIGSTGAITGGAITFSGAINQTGGAGLSINAITGGTVAFTNTVTTTGTTNSAISVSNVAAPASVTFANVALSNILAGPGINLSSNAGTVAFNGGSINQVVNGNGIAVANSNLTTSGLSIGNNTSFLVNGRGIDVTLAGANTRTISLTNTSIRSNLEALHTTDSATGTLNLALNGDTYQTLTGVKNISVVGSGLNTTIVRSFNGGTVIGNGTGGGVLFNRVTFDSDAGTAGNQQVAAGNWNIGQGTAARVAGDGLRFDAPTGDVAFGTLNIFNNAGTGLFVDTKTLGTTFALGSTGGAVNTTGGTAVNLDPLTTNLTFGTITSTNSGGANPGFLLDTVSGSVTVGTLSVTNAGGAGLVAQNSSGNFTFTNISIDGAGSDGIRLANNTGTFTTTAGGATTINNVTGDGIDLTGLTANPTVNMLGTVGITKFGGIGVNFTGASVTAAFGVTTINNVANGSSGTAIDLSSTTGTRTITFAAGSAISNVAVGVQIGATTGTVANANFTFGDGTSANGLQSSISATTTVAALGLDPAPNAPGVYNFNDVTFTGTALFQTAPGNAFFVSSTAANGAGDGSFANPYSVADANAITGAASFAFLDGTYNFSTLGANGFTLAANQTVAGLDNNNSIAYGVVQPNRVLGNFGTLGGTVTRANTGNGTLSITNGTAGGNVFTLSGSNTLTNITLTGEAGVNDPQLLILANGGSGGFDNTAGITIQGVTIGNVQAGSTALSFTAMTGTVLAQNNNLNASGGSLLNVNGGTGNISILKGTGSTLSGRSIIVTGTAGGSVQVTGATLATVGNSAVTLNNNAGTATFTNLAITRTAGDTAFSIDSGAGSTGAITINGTSSLDSTVGRAFQIGAGTRNIDATALNFTNIGTTAANVISVTGQTGGTISFGTVGITGFNNAAGTAVSLAGTAAGTVSFADLDIATAAGSGLNVGANTFAPGSSSTISAIGGSAVILNGTTLSGGTATFASVSASTTGGVAGISLTNTIGTTAFTTVNINGTGAASGIVLNHAGTTNISGGTIDNVGVNGIDSTNTVLTATGLTIGGTTAPTGNGIRVVNNDGTARLVTISNDNIKSVGDAIKTTDGGTAGELSLVLNGNTLQSTGVGSLAMNIAGTALNSTTINSMNGGTVTANANGGGLLFSRVTFDAVTGGAVTQVNAGTWNIGQGTGARVQGNGLNFQGPTGNVAFTTLNIFNNNGTGLLVNTKTLATTFTNLSNTAGAVDTTNGTALNLDPLTVNLTFTGVTSTNAATSGVIINTVGGTLALGNVSVTNATASGLAMTASSAAVTAGTVTVNGAASGLQFGANTGSFNASGATNLTNITGTGINANAATGTYTFQGATTISFAGTGDGIDARSSTGTFSFQALTINYTGAGRGLDFRSSTLTSFQTGNLSITGNGTAGSIAIDLSGSAYPGGQPVINNAPNIQLATAAGQTAAISAVGTGVKLGDGTVGSAGAYLRYGTQVTPTSGSTIAVIAGGVTIDTTNLSSPSAFQQGRYEFAGVTFTGQASFEGSNPNYIFVGSSAAGSANGSNPNNRISMATFLASDNNSVFLANKTIIFVNDGSINFGATTLALGTNTVIDGFGNNATVVVPGGTVPANVIGTFTPGGGSFQDLVNGAATLTASAGTNVITLSNGNTVQNININGGNNQIIGTGTAGFTLSGVNQTGAAASAITLTNSTGTIAMTGGSIATATGNDFVIDGGSSVVSSSGTINNSSGRSVIVQNRTGGSVTLSGAITDTGTGMLLQNNTGGTTTFSGAGSSFNTGATQAITLTNNTGATTLFTGNNWTVNTTSGTGFGASGGGTVGVSGTGFSLTSTTGTALSLNGVAIDAAGFSLLSVSDNGGANGIVLNNLTGGGAVGVRILGTGGAASGGTIQNTTGAAVSLTALGSLGGGVTLSNMSISGASGIVGTSFGTLAVANTSAAGTAGAGLSLTTGTITTGSVFTTLSSTGSATNGVLLSGVAGGFTANGGTITNATGAAWSVVGGTVSATYSGGITQGNNAALVSITGGHATGTITFNTGTLSATNGTGLQFDNADGTYNFNATTTLNGGDAGIDILNGSGGAFTFGTGTTITSPTGTAFVFDSSTAGVTYSGNITQANNALMVSITNQASGTITFQTGTLSASAGTGINLNNADGTVNFNGTTTLNGGNAHIDINTGSAGTITFSTGASVGATTAPTGVDFREDTSTASVTYNGTLRQTNAANAVSINAKTGGTTTFGGAITASTGSANAINLTGNAGGTINFTGGLSITTTSGVGFNATGGGTVNATQNNTTIVNTLSSTTGTALNIANTTIGASGVTFRSISANGGTNGIVLNTTGASGGLTVTGTGTTAGSGGTIQNTVQGALFTSTSNLSLSNMNFTNADSGNGTVNNVDTSTFNSAAQAAINLSSVSTASFTNLSVTGGGGAGGAQVGINGQNVSNLTIANSTVTGFGDAAGEGDVKLWNLTGTSSVTNSTFGFVPGDTSGGENLFEFRNTGGSLTLTFTGNTFQNTRDSSFGSGGLAFTSTGAGTVVNVNVYHNTFTNLKTSGIEAIAKQTSTMSVNITDGGTSGNGNTFDPGSGTGRAIGLSAQDTAALNFNINRNVSIKGNGGPIIDIFSINSAVVNGRIDNNTNIENNGTTNRAGSPIFLNIEDNSTAVVEIANNVINNAGQDSGITGNVQGDGGTTNNKATLDVSITGNTINLTGLNASTANNFNNGILLSSGASNNDATILYANLQNNAVTGITVANGNAGLAIENTGGASSHFYMQGFTTSPTNTWNIRGNTPTGSVVQLNSGTAPAVAAIPVGHNGGTVFSPSNANALLFAPGGAASATDSNGILTQASLNMLGSAAITLWESTGLTAQQISLLQGVTLSLGDLPGGYLGEALPGQIVLSSTAAGQSWFIDTTPLDNSEFAGTGTRLTAFTGSVATGHVDAFTVVLHEFGHELGLDDTYFTGNSSSLMYGSLTLGERRLPAVNQALGATPQASFSDALLLRAPSSTLTPSSPASSWQPAVIIHQPTAPSLVLPRPIHSVEFAPQADRAGTTWITPDFGDPNTLYVTPVISPAGPAPLELDSQTRQRKIESKATSENQPNPKVTAPLSAQDPAARTKQADRKRVHAAGYPAFASSFGQLGGRLP